MATVSQACIRRFAFARIDMATVSQYSDDMDQRYAIGQLVELTGTSRRVIRYYIAQGLLEPPLGAGRGHYYTAKHLHRLRQIASLKQLGLTLDEIRRDSFLNSDHPPAPVPVAKTRGRGHKSLRSELGSMQAHSLTEPRMSADACCSVYGESASEYAQRAAAGELLEQSVVGPFEERWVRIPLANGVELHLQKRKLGHTPEELREIVRKISDLFRRPRL
ncbi:MAG TPA: MerR family transcriptional regulator [Candidatus Ozemobacteraceae bacterium]|nr:MerR family transcriptional regulator [Candidatus Ozemobacteraceae bacterium]